MDEDVLEFRHGTAMTAHHHHLSFEVLVRAAGRVKVGIMSIGPDVTVKVRHSRRWTKSILSIASVTALASSATFGAATAATGASSNNRLVVSGAFSGVLVLGPTSACDIGSTGGELSAFATTLSTNKYKHWQVTYQTGTPVTNAKFATPPDSFVLGSGLNDWDATSGTITVTANSAKVNLTLKGNGIPAKGTLHVKGSWTCKDGVASN